MSLKERVVAKPLIPIALVAVIILLIIGICYQLNGTQPAKAPALAAASTPAPASNVTIATPASAPITTPSSMPAAAASVPLSTSVATAAAVSSPVASAPLPTNRATAEEELDRLSDEHARLVAQKADLAKQLAVSNKILALKEQQIKQLESSAH